MYQYEEVWIKENHHNYLSVYKRPMPFDSGDGINCIKLFPSGDISSNVWKIQTITADMEATEEEISINAVPERLVELGAMNKILINQNIASTGTAG